LLAEEPGPRRPADAGVLLVEDHLLQQRQVAPAALDRPPHPHPSAIGQLAFPRLAHVELGTLAHVAAAAQGGELADQMLGHPCANRVAKQLVLGRECELHCRHRGAT
jgi:hypothetical protein